MEASGGGFSNGLPGVTGPEGRQVSAAREYKYFRFCGRRYTTSHILHNTDKV